MHQYCVYTSDPKFMEVCKWISQHKIKYEVHLNRTRFWILEGAKLTEFLLKYSDICPKVKEGSDYAVR